MGRNRFDALMNRRRWTFWILAMLLVALGFWFLPRDDFNRGGLVPVTQTVTHSPHGLTISWRARSS